MSSKQNALEAQSIEIIHEAAATSKNPVMMYSVGKDSSVMLHLARSLFEPGDFFEVFVDTPLTECENRDENGLYTKARQSKIANLTGIDIPYKAPATPEIKIDTVAIKP